MAYRFMIAGEKGTDSVMAIYQGQVIMATSRRGAALALACKLVEEHAPDDRVEAVSVNHSPLWTSPNLHRLASLILSEIDQGAKRADSDEVVTLAGGGDIE